MKRLLLTYTLLTMMALSIVAADGVQQFYQLSGDAAVPTISMERSAGRISRSSGSYSSSGYSASATGMGASYGASPIRRLSKTAGSAVGGGSIGGGAGSIGGGRSGSTSGGFTGGGIATAVTIACTTYDSPDNARMESSTLSDLFDDEDGEQQHGGELAPVGSAIIPLLFFLCFYALLYYNRHKQEYRARRAQRKAQKKTKNNK